MTDEPADEPQPRISCLHPALFLTTVRIALISTALVLAVPAVLLLWAKDRMKETLCLGNHCHVGCALRNYVADHDGRLPPAEVWCDAIVSRYMQPREFRCQTLKGERSNVWLNAALAGQDVSTVTNAAEVVLTFEGADGWNQVGGRDDFLTPHHGRGNVSLLDGQYRRLNRELEPLDPERGSIGWRPQRPVQGRPRAGIGANLGWTGSGGEALGRLSSGASSGSVVEVSVAACEECADVFES